jgi:hypothetical protein
MEKNLLKNKTQSRLIRLLIISSAVLYSLYCFILAPIYTYICSDIVFSVTIVPEILSFILDIVDIIAYAVCFSIIIYSVYRFDLKPSVRIIVTVCAALFLKYTANFIMTIVVDGALNLNDITSIVIYFVLDVIWLTAITLISNRIIAKHKKKRDVTNKAAVSISAKLDDSYNVFPFKKLFDLSNPLQTSALVMGAIMGGVHMLTRIIYDLFYGLPTSLSDAMWMVTYYLSDVVSGFIMYTVALFIFMRLNSKDDRKEDTQTDVDR